MIKEENKNYLANNLFNSSLGIKFNIDQMIREIAGFMAEDRSRRYKIIIGSEDRKSVV